MRSQKFTKVLFLLIYVQISFGMNTMNETTAEQGELIYLPKTDPVYIEIKNRAISDWLLAVSNTDTASEKNKLRKEQIESWPREKQDEFESMMIRSLEDYNRQTHFNLEGFITFFPEIRNLDLKKFESETDFRVRVLDTNKFAAEFWEDGLAVNSEANAVLYAKELRESARAKLHPEEDLGNVEEIKKNYAAHRQQINSGKKKRFTKLMALLYVRKENKSIFFRDPGEDYHDFK
jgi:hypothetical protein